MKGKKHPAEDKIRILRAADGGKSIVEVCKEKNISEQTFHRWKRQFGMMEITMRPSGSRNWNGRTPR
ncbi:MAG: transposase [Candidatus Didemnitutus sp.]|nr:transposase [Candidatus Didemnitutus sp.]